MTSMTFNDLTSLKQAQQIVDQWIMATGQGYFSPLTNMAMLTEETGEVAHIIARRYGDQQPKASDNISHEALADELADLLWVTLAIANQTGVDLTQALARNLDKKTRRDAHRWDSTK